MDRAEAESFHLKAAQVRADRLREFKRANPYLVLLKLDGRKSLAPWGRFSTPERAEAAGVAAMMANRPADRPWGRKAVEYAVVYDCPE